MLSVKKIYNSVLVSIIMMVIASPSFAIIDGFEVAELSPIARSTVLIMADGYLCSGTIIGKDLVLTAAHCVLEKLDGTNKIAPFSKLVIYFGNLNQNVDISRARRVLDVQIPAKVNLLSKDIGKKSDIALIKIKGNLVEGFQPVKILKDVNQLNGKEVVTIAGYGNIYSRKNRENEPHSRILRSYPYVVSSDFSPNSMLTFEPASGGMASGDSGGPAFLEINGVLTLAGVASGYYNNRASYESVPRFTDWLSSTAKMLNSELAN